MSQAAFRAALLDPGLPVPSGLTDPQGRPAGRRFDVYRNNVSVSLTEALRQSFPVLRQLLGEEFFTALAQIFLRAHPPRSRMLMFYGEDMARFLEEFEPVSHLGYLPDVARLELLLRQSYHSADAAPLDRSVLAALDPEALAASRLRLAPSVRMLRSDWPVAAIWSANTRGTAPPTDRVAEDVLIVRPGFDPQPVVLPPGSGGFVAALIDGATVATAIGHGGFDLTATLGQLLAHNCITAIYQSGTQ